MEAGERWSWVVWYRDSATCADHGHEWFEGCAAAGNTVCQGLHAFKVSSAPGMTHETQMAHMVYWTTRAAEGGLPMAMLKLARAYLGRFPEVGLPHDPATAAAWLRTCIRLWGDAECHYDLAQMLLEQLTPPQASVLRASVPTLPTRHADDAPSMTTVRATGEATPPPASLAARVAAAVAHFESAARQGHAFAAYNLGVVHLFGHGAGVGASGPNANASLSAEWFAAASGLPEGMHAASLYYQANGQAPRAAEWHRHAEALGHGAMWRDAARKRVGSGGAGGVSLHSKWPEPSCFEAAKAEGG